MVQKQTIDEVRLQVADCSEDTLEREFDDFFRMQPEICEFVRDLTSASSQTVRELALYLSYVTYKAVSLDTNPTSPVLAPAIIEACRESQEWIQRVSRMDAGDLQSASADDVGDEPWLLGFVIAEVDEAIEDGLSLDDEEKGTIFFVLKTVIRSMTARA